jgi:transcriptional regulator with XRE-family HTH domain
MPDASKPQAALGSAIRQLRERAELSQEELADRAGLSRAWVSEVESGRKSPMWRTVEQLADGLGVRMIDITALVEALDRH